MFQSFNPLWVLAFCVVLYGYNRLRWMRFIQRRDIPQPESSLLLGHLSSFGKNMREVKASGAGGVNHPDYAFDLAHKRIGSPGVIRLDLRPAQYEHLVVMDHSVAEQLSKSSKGFKYGVRKSPTYDMFHDLVGELSVFSVGGEDWKRLRKKFNPGFAPAHLMTLLPKIVQETVIFLGHLDKLAKSGEEFEFNDIVTKLTFDIIGSVVLDADFNSQDPDPSKHSPVVQTFIQLIQYYTEQSPFEKLKPNYLIRKYRRGKLATRLTQEIQTIIRAKFEEGSEKPSTAGRSVLALSMQNTGTLDQQILDETSDQIKSFLFAGHDTTTILLQWTIYQLSLNPKVLATLRAELDAVLGPLSPTNDTPTAILERGEAALQKLTYTSAIIKETLRLFPPAGAARWADEEEGLRLRLRDGREINPAGMVIYINHYAIMRDPNVFGEDAAEWKPERWIGDTHTGMDDDEKDGKSGGGVPASAWRPFERGPRNCIGQELANLEARVILACLARRYVFEKVGMGAVVDGKIEEPLKNKMQITSRPVDNMKVKVRMLDQNVH